MTWRRNANEDERQRWLASVLSKLPSGSKLLDAGAGELRNRKHCEHLHYVSQDFCQYEGSSETHAEGLHPANWDVSKIDIVSDIASIPCPDCSFDAILCSEVLEHIPEPTHALDEFARLLRPGGWLILTAPFSSLVHFAPYHYCTGFTRYWYEHHLRLRGFRIETLRSNGDWYALMGQELRRLGHLQRNHRSIRWPVAYAYAALGDILFGGQREPQAGALACFGYHCLAVKG